MAPRSFVAVVLAASLLAGCSDGSGSTDPRETSTDGDAAPSQPAEREADCPAPPDLTGTFDPGDAAGEPTPYSSGSAAITVTAEDGSTTCVVADGVYDGTYGDASFDPSSPGGSADLGDVDGGLVVSARPPREDFPTAPVDLVQPSSFIAFQVDRTYYVGNTDCVVTVSALSAEGMAGTFDCGPISGRGDGPFDGTSEGPEAKQIKAVSGWFTTSA